MHLLPTTTSQQPPPPTVVQHRVVTIPKVSSPTTETPHAMLNLDDNYSSSDETEIEPAGLITTDHLAKWRNKPLPKPLQNWTDLPELPTFDPSQPNVLPHEAGNRLPTSFSALHDFTPSQIFNLILTNSIMGQLVPNSNSYCVGIHRWIFYCSSCSLASSSTKYLAAMLLLIKP